MEKVIKYNAPDVDDHKIFAKAVIPKAPDTNFSWIEAIDSSIGDITVIPVVSTNKAKKECQPLKDYIENSTTLATLIFRNDTLLYEQYSKGYGPYFKFNSFSMIKSLGIFPLLGIAIKEGYVKSLDDPITDYFPELKPQKKFKKITVRHLMNMTSGISESATPALPWSSALRWYYGDHLEREIKRLKIDFPPDKAYRYSVGANTQLISWMIERTTGKKIEDYFYEKIWSKIGAESEAWWCKDREAGSVKVFGFFFSQPRDFARLGRLILNKGNWNGEQIIPSEWVDEITSSRNFKKSSHRFRLFARQPHSDYFSMHWWVGTKGYNEYKASGFFGQECYLFPDKNTMILTFRERKGLSNPAYEVDLFYQIFDGVEGLRLMDCK